MRLVKFMMAVLLVFAGSSSARGGSLACDSEWLSPKGELRTGAGVFTFSSVSALVVHRKGSGDSEAGCVSSVELTFTTGSCTLVVSGSGEFVEGAGLPVTRLVFNATRDCLGFPEGMMGEWVAPPGKSFGTLELGFVSVPNPDRDSVCIESSVAARLRGTFPGRGQVPGLEFLATELQAVGHFMTTGKVGVACAGNPGVPAPLVARAIEKLEDSITPPPKPVARPTAKPSKKKSSNAFAGSELLVGRGVKQPTGAKMFSLGLAVQFAPMNMVLGSQKDTFVDTTVGAACAGNTQCEEMAAENMDDAMVAIAEIPDDDWEDLTTAATDDQAFDAAVQELVNDGTLTQEDATAVQGFTEELPSGEERETILTATRLLSKQEATSVMVEPNMEINFDFMSLTVRVPFAMIMFDEETKWNMGNLTFDTKLGHTFGSGMAAFGIGYGFSLYAPTGSEEASSMALADLWFGPKFMRGYLTAAPFVAMGLDSIILSVQAHGEMVSQHYVLDDGAAVAEVEPMPGHVLYGKYGAGAVLMPNWPLSIIAEVNGLVPIIDASAYNALFGIGGVQLRLFWLKAALAVQFPIIAPEPEDLGSMGGVSLGELASYSIIARAAFAF